jgi:hypothetical protein
MRLLVSAASLVKAVKGLTEDIQKSNAALVESVRTEIAARTPIKTGQARRGWKTRQDTVENRVPYIGKLESGSSRQARQGFVRQGIQAALTKQQRGKY